MHLAYCYGTPCCHLLNSTQQSPDLTPESSLERDAEKAKFGDKGYREKTNIRSKSQQVVCGY